MEDWMKVRAPFIPDHEFEHEPTEDDFAFVIFPDDDNEKFNGPQIYEQGELRPLLGRDSEPETDESRVPRESEKSEGSDEPEEPRGAKDGEHDDADKSEDTDDQDKRSEPDEDRIPYSDRELAGDSFDTG